MFSYPGATIRKVYEESKIIGTKYDYVLFMVGTNDSASKRNVAESIHFFKLLVDRFKTSTIVRFDIPPVNEDRYALCELARPNIPEFIIRGELFRSVCGRKQSVKKWKVALLNRYLASNSLVESIKIGRNFLTNEGQLKRKYTEDGLHINELFVKHLLEQAMAISHVAPLSTGCLYNRIRIQKPSPWRKHYALD